MASTIRCEVFQAQQLWGQRSIKLDEQAPGELNGQIRECFSPVERAALGGLALVCICAGGVIMVIAARYQAMQAFGRSLFYLGVHWQTVGMLRGLRNEPSSANSEAVRDIARGSARMNGPSATVLK